MVIPDALCTVTCPRCWATRSGVSPVRCPSRDKWAGKTADPRCVPAPRPATCRPRPAHHPCSRQVHLPVRPPDAHIQLPLLARQPVSTGPQLRHRQRCELAQLGPQLPAVPGHAVRVPARGGVGCRRHQAVPHPQHVTPGDRVAEGLRAVEDGGRVRPVHPTDPALQLAERHIGVGQQCGRVLGGLLALLVAGVPDDARPQLLDAPLRLRAQRKRLRKLHAADHSRRRCPGASDFRSIRAAGATAGRTDQPSSGCSSPQPPTLAHRHLRHRHRCPATGTTPCRMPGQSHQKRHRRTPLSVSA